MGLTSYHRTCVASHFLVLLVLFNSTALVSCFNLDVGDSAALSVNPLDEQSLIDSGDFSEIGDSSGAAQSDAAALESTLLQKELKKLPFSQSELGEGAQMRAKLMKQDSYDRFKELSDTIEQKKIIIEQQLLKTVKEKSKIEKKELQARQAATDLRKKIKTMVPSDAAEKAKAEAAKLKSEIEQMKVQAKQHQDDWSGLAAKAKKKAAELTSKLSQSRQDSEKKLADSEGAEEEEVGKIKSGIKKRYFLNMADLTAMKKKVADTQDELKDLRTKVKDAGKSEDETVRAMETKEKQDLDRVQTEDATKLSKEKVKEKALGQKLEWDKRTVMVAKDGQKAEGKAMAAALNKNQGIEANEKKEKDAVKQATTVAQNQEAQDATIKKQLDLGNAIEQEKEKVGAERIEDIRKRAELKLKEKEAEEQAGIKSAQDGAADAKEKLTDKLDTLKEKLKRNQDIENSDISAVKAKMSMENRKQEASLQAALTKSQDDAEHTLRQKVAEDEKIDKLKANLEDEKQQENDILGKEKAEAANFKQILSKEDASLQKRMGARQEAAELESEAAAKDKQIKALSQEDKMMEGSIQKMSDDKQKLTKNLEDEEDLDGQAEYKATLAKEQEQSTELELKKLKLKYRMLQQQAKHDATADTDDQALEQTERKYEREVQMAAAATKQVEMLKAHEKLGETRAMRLEQRADKYKEEKYDEIQNTKRVAESVRTRWSTKLITEEAKHAKELMKLKHKMETQQLKLDQRTQEMRDKLEKETQKEEKAASRAKNMEMAEKYALDVVGEEQTKNKVANDYSTRMQKVRKRYNKGFQVEYAKEITKLKKQLSNFKNHHEYAKLKLQMVMLEGKLKQATAVAAASPRSSRKRRYTQGRERIRGGSAGRTGRTGRRIGRRTGRRAGRTGRRSRRSRRGRRAVEMPPQEHYNMDRLLSSALDHIDKSAAGHTTEEQSKRISKAVNAVVASGTKEEHRKATELVDAALDTHLGESPAVQVSSSNHVTQIEPNALLLPGLQDLLDQSQS